MNNWNPRDEILLATHRWYWIAVSFLLGALLGWLVSFLWPASYRASLDVYVGVNAYRTTRDLYIAEVAQVRLINLDDYKNWQIQQLYSLAFSDEYLEETLSQLQADSLDWQNVSVQELREMLSIAWRNTGDWHFSAQALSSQQAKHAVSIWTKVVVEKGGTAVEAARDLVIIDSQLNAVSHARVAANTRQTLLLETQSTLTDWEAILVNMPSDQIVLPLDHWNLIAQVSTASAWNWGWISALETAPPLGSYPADYLAWLQPVKTIVSAEISSLTSELASLEQEYASLSENYKIAAEQSRALSANVEISQIKNEPPQVIHLRPVGTLVLIGGLLGILVLMAGWVVYITRNTE